MISKSNPAIKSSGSKNFDIAEPYKIDTEVAMIVL